MRQANCEIEIMKYYCEAFSKIPTVKLDISGNILEANSWFGKIVDTSVYVPKVNIERLIEFLDTPAFSVNFEYCNEINSFHFYARPRNQTPSINYQGLAIRCGNIQFLFFSTRLDESARILETVTSLNMEISSLVRDLTKKNQQLVKANKKISDLLDSDTLTGVRNRRYASAAIDRNLALVRRKNCAGFSLIMFDLDRFKQINDNYGHDLGDQVLIKVTSLFSGLLRQEDVLARFGGEEFVIILANQNAEQSTIVAEKLRIALEQEPMPNELKVTASFGIAVCSAGDTKESLLKRADEAMYKAKASGRNKIICGD